MIEDYMDVARDKLGITYLRPYQELVIKHILDYESLNRKTRVLCSLPTGGGKSLCFMLPILLVKKTTIIIYPLISLMNDQRERFENAGIPIEIMQGGMKREERYKAIDRLRRKDSIAMLTSMEMLIYLSDSGLLRGLEISMVVIDEVHTVITWGNTFRSSYKEIGRILELLKPNHILAFSATMDKAIINGIVERVFSSTLPYLVRDSSNRENIFYISIAALNKVEEVRQILRNKDHRPSIIFCNSRRLTEDLAKLLSKEFASHYYHANLPQDEKKKIEKWFGETEDGVLTATIAFGMGVDISHIRSVIHYSLPQEASAFLQESGRAGRDGKPAYSFILSYPEEESKIKNIFRGDSCIRNGLLKAMNEETGEEHCLGCNHCLSLNYNRAGEERIISYIKHFPLITINRASYKLTRNTLFPKSKHLQIWKEKDVRRAIDILIEERRIRAIFKRFLIAKKDAK